MDDRAPAVMADLNYLVSWLLRSLSNHLSRPSFKKSKKAGTFEEVLVAYLDLWLSCLIKTATTSAQDSDAVALSSRVAFEVALSIRMKLRKGSLSLFASTVSIIIETVTPCVLYVYLLQVSSELVSSKQCGQSHSIDQYIHIIARTACKVVIHFTHTQLLPSLSRCTPAFIPATSSAQISLLFLRVSLRWFLTLWSRLLSHSWSRPPVPSSCSHALSWCLRLCASCMAVPVQHSQPSMLVL